MHTHHHLTYLFEGLSCGSLVWKPLPRQSKDRSSIRSGVLRFGGRSVEPFLFQQGLLYFLGEGHSSLFVPQSCGHGLGHPLQHCAGSSSMGFVVEAGQHCFLVVDVLFASWAPSAKKGVHFLAGGQDSPYLFQTDTPAAFIWKAQPST